MSDSRDFLSAWARDGKSVLFDSNRTGRSQIFRQKFEQSAAEPLVMTADDASGASLSPDGAWILYWSSPHSSDQSPQPFRLMRVPARGDRRSKFCSFPPTPSLPSTAQSNLPAPAFWEIGPKASWFSKVLIPWPAGEARWRE